MPTKSIQPTHEDIMHRAYLIWEQAGRPHGCAAAHWKEAEMQLRAAAIEPIAPAKQIPPTKCKPAARTAGKSRQFAAELVG